MCSRCSSNKCKRRGPLRVGGLPESSPRVLQQGPAFHSHPDRGGQVPRLPGLAHRAALSASAANPTPNSEGFGTKDRIATVRNAGAHPRYVAGDWTPPKKQGSLARLASSRDETGIAHRLVPLPQNNKEGIVVGRGLATWTEAPIQRGQLAAATGAISNCSPSRAASIFRALPRVLASSRA